MISIRVLAISAIAASVLLGAAPALAQAQRAEVETIVKDYLAKNPQDVERIVKDYLLKNPDLLQDAINEFVKRRSAGGQSAADKTAAIKTNAALLFNSPRQVTLGDRQGDVALVEFFDYNCGFCKRALSDKLELMKSDPKLKVVLKEFPVLGQGSVEAAEVAVAVRMQDPGGQKYLAFHERLLGSSSPANKASALAVARGVGLDVARIERDLTSSEIKDTLDESRKLAGALGINGTPSYVVGERVAVGAVGVAALADLVKAARK